MNEVVWRTRQERDANAWSGEVDDLRRVISLVKELTEIRIQQILSGFTEEQNIKREYWEEQAKGVRLEITDKTDSITGPPDEIFEQLDRRTVQSVRIFAELGNTDEHLEVTFRKISRISYRKAVEIRIRSVNPGWAKQCLAQLSEELDKSVPKWAWFRSGTGTAMSAATIYIATVGMVVLIVDRHSPKNLGPAIALALSFGIWLVLAILFIWPWIFPAFELYGQGGSSTGGRRLAAISTFVAGLVAAILGALIT